MLSFYQTSLIQMKSLMKVNKKINGIKTSNFSDYFITFRSRTDGIWIPNRFGTGKQTEERLPRTSTELLRATGRESRLSLHQHQQQVRETERERGSWQIISRFRSLSQANQLLQFVADHLELPKQVFSESRWVSHFPQVVSNRNSPYPYLPTI